MLQDALSEMNLSGLDLSQLHGLQMALPDEHEKKQLRAYLEVTEVPLPMSCVVFIRNKRQASVSAILAGTTSASQRSE